jgi:DNA polymerase V
MIQAAREVLDKTYKDGLKYAKAGVMLSGICEYAVNRPGFIGDRFA